MTTSQNDTFDSTAFLFVDVQTSRRWCLTGTPIQNTVDDLYSYFRFLKYEPYSRHAAFKSMLTEPLQSNPSHGGKLLRAALQVKHNE